MIAKYIRFTNSSKEAGWVGMAVAPNMESLFWVIDEMGDPFSCQIKSVGSRGSSICFTVDRDCDVDPTEEEDDVFLVATRGEDSLDYSVHMLDSINDDNGWKTPTWEKNRVKPVVASIMGWRQP